MITSDSVHVRRHNGRFLVGLIEHPNQSIANGSRLKTIPEQNSSAILPKRSMLLKAHTDRNRTGDFSEKRTLVEQQLCNGVHA